MTQPRIRGPQPAGTKARPASIVTRVRCTAPRTTEEYGEFDRNGICAWKYETLDDDPAIARADTEARAAEHAALGHSPTAVEQRGFTEA